MADRATPPAQTCAACAQLVYVAHTEGRKAVVVDPTPVPDGNVLVEYVSDVRLEAQFQPVGREGYANHLVTCPAAGR